MKKYAVVLASAAVALILGVGNASATETPVSAGKGQTRERVLDIDSTPAGEHWAACEQIGSNLVECTHCSENSFSKVSICETYTVHNGQDHLP